MTAEPAPLNGGPAGVVDLVALAAEHPPRTVALDIARALQVLTQGEVIDAADAAGVSLELIRARGAIDPGVAEGYRLVRAIAWVLQRRITPDVTWEEAQGWNVEASAGAPDPKEPGTTSS